MKLLHFADLHLGVENYGRIDPQSGLSTRFMDFLSAFDEVVDYALIQDIDAVIFCGDAYKSREPSQTHQREFARRVWRMASAGVPVFLLTGNHDLPNAFGRATTMEIFRTLEIANVTVASQPGTYRMETKSGPLQVVALPWARRNALLSREETKGLTPDEVNHRIERILTERLQGEIASLEEGTPAVLAAHATLSNASVGSERGMMMGHDYVLLQGNIANPAFDYVALGHIHKQQVLSESPPVVYAGSLQRIDFSEEKEDKGFFVVEIGDGKGASFQFHPVKARSFISIGVKVGEGEVDPTPAVLKAIAARDVTDAIVRVQIALPEGLAGLLNEGEVRRALKDAHFIAAISREVERERRPRLADLPAEELTTREALKAYLEVRKTEVDAKTLLEYGERLIQESEAGDGYN